MNTNALLAKPLIALFILLLSGRIFSQNLPAQDAFVPFDTVVHFLEQKHAMSLYFKPEWFEKKRFHESILTLPVNEVINLLKNSGNCTVVAIDSSSLVFVPFNSSTLSMSGNSVSNCITIGNPAEYGKYSRATVNGKIIDAKTGEPLVGARLYVEKTKSGVTADKNGNFTITLPVGEYDVKLTYIGYQDNMNKIKLIGSGTATFEIIEKTINLNEVVITSERPDHNLLTPQMSLLQFSTKDIKELPVSMGETDIIKSVTLLPGIQTIGEFGTGFNVRGGGADQNLILIEDVPIFNSSHLFGLTSILNPDGVSGVTLLKAGIPAKYGERASSVMDIRMGNSTFEKLKAKGGIGLLNSRLSVETPLFKNKAVLSVGGRTTYSDWLLHRMPDLDLMNSSANFYDLNAYLAVSPDNNNKITGFGYYSNDNFAFSHNIHYQYASKLASVRWNHIFSQKLSSSLMTGMSLYDYHVNERDTLQPEEAYRIHSQTVYNNIKWNVAWHVNNNHVVDMGLNAVFYTIKPGNLSPYDSISLVEPRNVQKERANEYAGYISDNFSISSDFSAEIGLRCSWYTLLGPKSVNIYRDGSDRLTENITDTVFYKKNKVVKSYSGLEPRLSLRYSIDDLSSVKVSYNRINQYINQVSNTSVMTPSDVWKLSDTYIKPLKSVQYAIGYFRNFNQNTFETSIEVYYKTLKDVVEYKNGATILLNDHLETDLLNARGYTYGAELYVKKVRGRLTGWASYTFSKSMRKTTGASSEEQINNNNYFPSNYDKPNSLILNANYHISRRWRFSGSFTYNTGRPVTLPELKYNFDGYELVYYSDRNKYRLPDYHRLDVSITLDESLRLKKKWKGSWTLSIINLYGRKNPFSVYYKKVTPTESNNYRTYSLFQLYIIGRPLPTLTYNFNF
jgi:hypothetical protein